MTLTPEKQTEVIALLQNLVRAASYSGQEKQAGEVAAAAMRALHFDRVWVDDFGSVVGERRGSLPGPTLLFDGHMDVVNAGNLKEWVDDPFSGLLKDGKIYGRGATDTKSSLAAMITAVGSLAAEQIHGRLVVVGSVGEEIIEGGGLRKVLEAVKPDGVIVGEPSDCRLGIGQKGRARILFTAHGRSAHSSTPANGENAVLKAAEILRRVESLPLPEAAWLGRGVMVPLQISSSPFPSTSIIPYECQIAYDRRLVAGETPESVLGEYHTALADLPGWDVAVDTVSYDTYTGRTIRVPDFHHAWLMDEHSAWIERAAAALRGAGIDPGLHAVPYCTNGSVAAGEFGLPTLIFGPSTIHLAHVVNEYIPVEELFRAVEGYRALAL